MKFAVLDSGLFVDLASSLSDGGKHKVLYHVGWSDDPFPGLQDFAPGTGYEYLTKVKRLSDIDWDEVDCIVCFDVNRNDEIVALREQYPDKSIVGSGRGAVLEEDRVGMKKRLAKLGLDVFPYEVVKGVDALEDWLKSHSEHEHFVKIDIFRRSLETIKVESYAKAIKQGLFTQIREEFGPVFSRTLPFLVEQEIESEVEIGFDGFFTPGGGYLDKCLVGYEYRKGPYIGKVLAPDDLPEPLADTLRALKPSLEEFDYRGPLSTEERIVPSGRHYLIDFCARLLAPGSSVYPYAIRNWPDLIYRIGVGGEAEVDLPETYVGSIPLHSVYPDSEKKYVYLDIDPEYRDRIRPQSACSNGKDAYAVRGSKWMATVVAKGESVEEVVDNLKASARHIRFEGYDLDQVRALDNFPNLIEKGEEVGIDFTTPVRV